MSKASEHKVIRDMHAWLTKNTNFIRRCQSGIYKLNFNVTKVDVKAKMDEALKNDAAIPYTEQIVSGMHYAIDTDADMILSCDSGQYWLKFDTPLVPILDCGKIYSWMLTGEQSVKSEFHDIKFV